MGTVALIENKNTSSVESVPDHDKRDRPNKRENKIARV